MATQTGKNAAGEIFSFELPLSPGRAAAAASRPVVLSSEDFAALTELPAGAATSAAQATNTAAVNLVGTRAYGTALTRVAVASSSGQSAAITATEVLLHASTRCFVKAASNPTSTVDDIPLEAGEKFHMRITSGHKIAVLRDTADGFLNIVPVA